MNAYGTDMVWRCACGASGHNDCVCAEAPVRHAILGRLTAHGVFLLPGAQALPLERLAALLVVLDDPFWSESDSVLEQDASQMIQTVKEWIRQ